jgi:hypothetical protein
MKIRNFILGLLLVLTPITSYGKMPPPMIGENFQRVDSLIDCQNLRVDKLDGAHKDVNLTVCFYKAYYIKGDQKIEFVLAVGPGSVEFLPSK